MNICIYGAGAIGGFLGARLGAAGHHMSAVARGPTLAALRAQGFRLEMGGDTLRAAVNASADPRDLGPQDLVIVAVKGPAMPAVAAGIGALLGPDTIVLSAMNGVPWWFFAGMPGPLAGLRLDTLDPDGVIDAAIPAQRVVGCVVHASCSTPAPGVVRHAIGHGLIVGEADAAATAGATTSATARSESLTRMLTEAGFEARVAAKIQQDVWYKLWGNMTMNPVSAITGALSDGVLDDVLVNRYCHAVMREAAAVGSAIGCPIAQSPEDRNAITRKLGAFRTSMLQDVEAGRPLEIDALLTAVREIATRVEIPTPYLDALLGLTRLFARTRGLYPA